MAKSLSDIRKVTASLPPRLIINGPPGSGKTSLAAEFPANIFIQTEDGNVSGLHLDSFGDIEHYDDVIDALKSLASDQHDYRNVTIDSVGRLEKLVWQKTCEVNEWDNIEAPGYGKGYAAADIYWNKIVDCLDYLRKNHSIGAIIISHSDIINTPNPVGKEFPAYDIHLHKRAHKILTRMADAILMINFDISTVEDRKTKNVKSSGSTSRWIYCEGSPALTAKNRYSLPPKFLYNQGQAYQKLSEYFPR